MSGFHASLTGELKKTLKAFANAREKTSMNDVVIYALTKLFDQENVDPRKHNALKIILDRKFSVPKAYSVRTFLTSLYINADVYPKKSAKEYWGPIVYLSQVDKSHKQILTEIQEELKRALNEDKK